MIKTRIQNIKTATSIVAVFVLSIILGACVTPSQIDELRADIGKVQAENRKTQQLLVRIDSLMAVEQQNDQKLRNDMSYTSDELQRQVALLLENYNEMMNQLNQIASGGRVTHVVRSSPGSQQKTADTLITGESAPPLQQAAIDCQKAYDEAFILVRQGEYENAISKFSGFMAECENHASAENARYWMGECYYSLGKFLDAIEHFQALLDRFKGSVNSGRALYKIGRCNQELGKNDEAKKIYQRVIDEFPQTLEAEQSKERLKDIG